MGARKESPLREKHQTYPSWVKATPPSSSGQFVLYPVPVGTYDLVVTSPGRVTAAMSGVPVTATAYTYVNSAALPIAPAPVSSAPRIVSGTVAPPTASVRALQTLTGGPTIQVAWAPVDAASGNFAFSLPLDPPLKLGYVPNPVALPFAADSGAASKYTIEAASSGAVQTRAIDVSSAVAPLSFVFP